MAILHLVFLPGRRSFLIIRSLALLTCVLLSAPSVLAQTLVGTVTNSTTSKPAAGDEIVLVKLAQGMDEVDRVKSDNKGAFRFQIDDPTAPHLVRATHQGVTYYRMAPPGMTSVDLEVYDVVKKVQEITVTADVLRVQATNGSLQVVRRFAVSNSSSPPRTQMNEQNFEFYLPDGAQIDNTMAKSGAGQPVNSSAVPQKEKNRYAFLFPLRPGQTEFQVAFHLPYSGSASVDPKPLYSAQHFVIVLPKSMQFSSDSAGYQSMQDSGQSDTLVRVATNTQVGQPLGFRVSGTGTLPEAQSAGGMRATGPQGSANSVLPGNASSSSGWTRWYVVGGFLLVGISAAIHARRHSQPVRRGRVANDLNAPVNAVAEEFDSTTSLTFPAEPVSSHSGLIFEALKDELFELEMDHKQGRLSPDEYAKAKSALDQTLERALKRRADA